MDLRQPEDFTKKKKIAMNSTFHSTLALIIAAILLCGISLNSFVYWGYDIKTCDGNYISPSYVHQDAFKYSLLSEVSSQKDRYNLYLLRDGYYQATLDNVNSCVLLKIRIH